MTSARTTWWASRVVLGDKAATMIVAEQSYEVSDPTVDSQIVALKASGADLLVTFATPKFAAQVIRKVADVGWKPMHYLTNVSTSVGAVLQPAGLDRAGFMTGNDVLMDGGWCAQ